MTVNELLNKSVNEIADLRVEEILSVLIQVPSVNPLWQWTTTTVANENAMANFLTLLFGKLESNASVTMLSVEESRPNVIVKIHGKSSEWTVWDTHIDTVGVEGMTINPFGGEIRAGRVYGRGACDTKASAAIAIKLIFEAVAQGRKPKNNLLLIFSMGEENGCVGIQQVNQWIKRRKIVVSEWITSEPTMLQSVYAHNGVIRGSLLGLRNRKVMCCFLPTESIQMCFEITGVGAHTSTPNRGVNALYAAAKLALRIKAVSGLHVTAVECGGISNTVPNYCVIYVHQDASSHISREKLVAQVIELASGLTNEHVRINCVDLDTPSPRIVSADSEVIYAALRAALALEVEHQRLISATELITITGSPVISATGLTSNEDGTCTICFDRRVVPGEDPERVFEALLTTLQGAMESTEVTMRERSDLPVRRNAAFIANTSCPLIQELIRLSGNPPTTVPFGTNMAFTDPAIFVGGGTNAVIFGPGDIAQAHTKDEFIEIEQLELALSLMRQYFGLTT